MTFAIDTSDIHLNNPYTAGSEVVFDFEVHNTSPDMNTTGHNIDHVEVWDHTGAILLNQDFSAMPVDHGHSYHTMVHVPALSAGSYDVQIKVDSGAAEAGSTIVVQ
jgi:hypothetical protein